MHDLDPLCQEKVLEPEAINGALEYNLVYLGVKEGNADAQLCRQDILSALRCLCSSTGEVIM